jgi:hypothetical protein
MNKDAFGVWEVTLPAKDGVPVIPHESKIKVRASYYGWRMQLTGLDHNGYSGRRGY